MCENDMRYEDEKALRLIVQGVSDDCPACRVPSLMRDEVGNIYCVVCHEVVYES